jgi:hypothetical protein
MNNQDKEIVEKIRAAISPWKMIAEGPMPTGSGWCLTSESEKATHAANS